MTYKQALKHPETDLGKLAIMCQVAPFSCGAVSPELIFKGAQVKGIGWKKLQELVNKKPLKVEELMWA
jgi:hypothetical protein